MTRFKVLVVLGLLFSGNVMAIVLLFSKPRGTLINSSFKWTPTFSNIDMCKVSQGYGC